MTQATNGIPAPGPRTVSPDDAGLPGQWTALIQRAGRGDRSAIDAVLAAALPIAHRAIRRMTAEQDVDDAVQEAMIDVLRGLRTIREPERFPAWVGMVARRAACHHFAKANRLLPIGDPERAAKPGMTPAASVPSPVEIDDLIERLAVVGTMTAALEELAAGQRDVVQALMATDDVSYSEVASRLQRPIGSLGPTRQRAFDRLRSNERVLALVG